jgi:flagellar hook-associated protein 1 FlgK
VSTFSGLNTAYSGLVAARNGIDVVGQNIANANTEGYTRQRISTSAVPPTGYASLFAAGFRAGEGVSVEGVSRLGDSFLDARVRSSAATSGYWMSRAEALTNIESTLQEPGENGLSTQLNQFWSAWQGLANQVGEAAPAGVLLAEAGVLVTRISAGFNELGGQWAQLRGKVDGMVSELNNAAAQVADLNATIRSTLAAGQSANELLDRRGVLSSTIASLAGGTVRASADGSVEVLIGGNAIVSGDTFRPVQASGAYLMDSAEAFPVSLEWADPTRSGKAIDLQGGEIAGALSALAPADGSRTGGAIAEAAEEYNSLATSLAEQVNALHRTGQSTTGETNLDFFGLPPGVPAARGLFVIPADMSGIAAGEPGAGAYAGTIADKIAQLSVTANSPSKVWSNFVTRIGVATRSDLQQAVVADLTATSARSMQLAGASVDMDEENVNLLTYQVAYQGAARVLTAIDEMLEVLINRTGLVGR